MNNDDEKISSLYHEANAAGPSKTLDDTILAASRDAVEKPAATKGPFSGGWPAAASIAAVIVITIILVPILKQEAPPQFPAKTAADKSSTDEYADETLLKAYSDDEMKKKTLLAPVPASEPVQSLQEDSSAIDHALPGAGSISSRAASSPSAAELSFSETEQKEESTGIEARRSSMEAADSAPFAIHTPEMWEVKISRLIEEGKLQDASAEIEKLKQHYPEYQISNNLLEKLGNNHE